MSRSSCAIVLSLTVVSLHLLGNRRSGVLKKTDRKVSFNGETLDDWGTYVYSNMELRRTEFRMVMVITEGQSALKMIFVRGITVLL